MNIALIVHGKPVFETVHVPVTRLSYWGGLGLGSWKRSDRDSRRSRSARPCLVFRSRWWVAAHLTAETEAWRIWGSMNWCRWGAP